MAEQELIGAGAPPEATTPLSNTEVWHGVQGSNSRVFTPELMKRLGVRRLVDSDGVPGTGPLTGALIYPLTVADYGGIVWLEDIGTEGVLKFLELPADAPLGTTFRCINMPTPGGAAAASAQVYCGRFTNTVVTVNGVVPSGGPPIAAMLSGNGLHLTRVADQNIGGTDYQVWEAVSDYEVASGPTAPPAAHASTHATGGTDALSLYDFEPPAPVSLGGFSDANFAEGGVGEMRGHVDGFNVTMLVRIVGTPGTGLQSVFGNWNPFQPDGGWFIGFDNDRWKFGLGQQSDGQVVESTSAPGLADFAHGGRFHRWHLVSMTYIGGTGYLVVDGEVVASLTPTGGYEVADVLLAPRLGKTWNAGVPAAAVNAYVAFWQYGESGGGGWSGFTTSELIYQHLSSTQQRIINIASSVGDSRYIVVDANDSGFADDAGARSIFTENGALYGSSFPNIW